MEVLDWPTEARPWAVVMKWFTRAWHDRQAGTDAFREYESHLRELELPAQVQELTRLDLHDGLFMDYALEGPDVRLQIHCGDLQSGYREVTLRYIGGRAFGARNQELSGWLSAPETEILFDELDADAGRYEHRFLLWPRGEFGIRFCELAVNDVLVDGSYRSKRFQSG